MRAPPRSWLRPLLCLLWLALLLTISPAAAQSTGGSFGGGSFDEGGGGGGGGGDWGGGGSGDSGSSSYSTSDGGGGEMTPGAAVVLLLLLLIPALISAHLRKKAQQKEAGAGTGRWKKMDVTAIRLALDWRSRPKIQAALKRLAREGESGSPEGRRRLLSATVSLLQEESSAWLYAGASDYSPMSPPQAEGIFRQLAIDARSRFKEEVIRDAEGRREEREASPLRARPQEGEGVVVITLIVAARRELKDLGSRHDAQELRRALQRLKKLHPGELVALEVVWSPAEEEDRMSTLELEALYPEMSLIHPGSVAGRVSCGSCGGPYPAELRRCPHCGAPGGASGGERS